MATAARLVRALLRRRAPRFDRWVGFRVDGLAAVMRAMH